MSLSNCLLCFTLELTKKVKAERLGNYMKIVEFINLEANGPLATRTLLISYYTNAQMIPQQTQCCEVTKLYLFIL